MNKLTQQQKNFVQKYITTLDALSALEFAGYKTKNKIFAQQLLVRPEIVNEIKKQLNQQIKSLNVEKGYVIQKLLQIAEFSLEEEDVLDKDGNYTGKKKLRDTTAGLKALDTLSKYLGFNSAPKDSNYINAKIITISNLDDTKI